VRSRLARTLRGWAYAVDPVVDDDDGGGGGAADDLRERSAGRSGAALSLLDDECLGYFMLQVRDGEPTPEVFITGDCQEEHGQAVGTTLHQVAREAYGVRY
jgi:hypothetical protein